jgi:hypothetical protein
LWAQSARNEIRFYHWLLLDDFPGAWTLFPVVGLLALARHRQLATLGLAVFVTGFATHTFLAWKAARYVGYLMPFFALVVGLGVAQAAPLVQNALATLAPGRSRFAVLSRAAVGAVAIVFLLGVNGAVQQSARRVMRDQRFLYPGGPTPTLSWELAATTLRPMASTAATVVSTEDLEAIWFLGKLDYVLDRDHIPATDGSREFAVDRRVMARVIGETESLRAIIACHSSGLLVAMRWALNSYKMAPETAAFIVETLEPVPIPERSGLVAFRWQHAAGTSLPACDW